MKVPRPHTPSKEALPSPQAHLLKALTTVAAGVYGLVCAWDPKVYRFLDGADLIFHEAGHVILGLFGEFIGVLGGSLMQILVPAAAACSLWSSAQRWSATVVLVWVAQSLFNVSVYIKDARAQALPLLGGEGVRHDWGYLLGRLHLARWDQAIGNLVFAIGVVALVTSVLGGLRLSLEEGQAEEG